MDNLENTVSIERKCPFKSCYKNSTQYTYI